LHPFTFKPHDVIFPYCRVNLIFISLIHLSAVKHLGYFQSLAIVNSAAINIGVQVYYNLTYAPTDVFPKVESLHHVAVLLLAF
jgi:hypothetical protein